MKVFFDLDPTVYMAGFAAQSSIYSTVWERNDIMHETFHTDGREAQKFRKELEEGELVEACKDIQAKPVGFARQCAKTVIKGTLTAVGQKFKTSDIEPYYFLTGKGNFREEVATIKKYKGNRDEMVKPVHYEAIREYLIDVYGAYVIEGQEADDEVSLRAWKHIRNNDDQYVVVSIDKDLDQIPGWHYDYNKHVFYHVRPEEAEEFFYAQILSGDTTDNIAGCYRIGLAKAQALVAEWRDEWIQLCQKPGSGVSFGRYVWDRIVEMFEKNMSTYPDKHEHELSAEQAALETARLVYMRQHEGEMWTPET